MPIDPKQGEREYYARIGEAGITHAQGKPFTDEKCNRNLGNLTAIFNLLPEPPAKVIEFGCGVGWMSIMLARRGFTTTGVDISPDAIAAATAQRDALGLDHLDFVLADYEEIVGDASYDAAIFYEALHHAENEADAIASAYRSLKPGGIMIAFEPGKGHGDTTEAKQVVAEFGVHEKDMPIPEIVRLATAAGFRRHLTLPQPWDFMRTVYRPSYAHAKSSSDARGKFILGVFRAFRRFFFQRPDLSFVVLWK
ncbi:class I SAM-dependent methyltransferase [Synoicihabitans lomoniglobus]|uniref:Class I SAM-dependent methyltransferase n=1 Tax=Synoicihabitans lomoniglobus TaxID=2909285 RepID=A0AAF0CSU1_9BACT|nr:class I SAM-dependent methyltransferase [Opitutaceae bacterium LMO-M01]WED67493.1 class I SAM-dependent methyltransferase [Opitutaceae bacterium LMO-M01]